MKLERGARSRGTPTRQGSTAQALRDLIRAEMAYERAAEDGSFVAAELSTQVDEARERYRRLVEEPAPVRAAG